MRFVGLLFYRERLSSYIFYFECGSISDGGSVACVSVPFPSGDALLD